MKPVMSENVETMFSVRLSVHTSVCLPDCVSVPCVCTFCYYRGFIQAFTVVSDNTAAGIICILVSVFWSVCAVIGAILLLRVSTVHFSV